MKVILPEIVWGFNRTLSIDNALKRTIVKLYCQCEREWKENWVLIFVTSSKKVNEELKS